MLRGKRRGAAQEKRLLRDAAFSGSAYGKICQEDIRVFRKEPDVFFHIKSYQRRRGACRRLMREMGGIV